MYFDSFAAFIAMGRHGLYVWLSYGVFLAVILWNIWLVTSTRLEAIKLTKQALRRANADTNSVTKTRAEK